MITLGAVVGHTIGGAVVGTFISVGITLVEDYLLDGTINTDSSEYYTSAAQVAEAGVKTGLASAIVGYRLPNDFKCGPYK